MIPIALAVGFVGGVAASGVLTSPRQRWIIAGVGLAVVVAWGIVIGVDEGSIAAAAGAAGLALANVVVAAVLGAMAWWVLP